METKELIKEIINIKAALELAACRVNSSEERIEIAREGYKRAEALLDKLYKKEEV